MTAVARPRQAPRRRPQERPRPPLFVYEGPAPTRSWRDRRRAGVLAGAVLFGAILAGNVAVQAQTTQGQFELERLQAAARQRQAAYQKLRLEVAELEAPQRILGRARQLGMVEPARVTYLTPTAATSSPAAGGTRSGPVSTSEAAQRWSDVKPHLDSRR